MFEDRPARRFEAISAIIDLEGFTSFCSQPDNHRKLAHFLNLVFAKASHSLQAANVDVAPIHFKFLGDGALYIWRLENQDAKALCRKIVLGFHNLYRTFPEEIVDELEELGALCVPRRIRVGIAQGELTELRTQDNSDPEYVGFSINLAARLQHYCPAIGFFIASGVSLADDFLEEYSLIRARPKPIRGMRGVDVEVRYVREDAGHLPKSELTKWLVHS